ncbi:MAG: rhodanese-like domain-containing protein [Candidatus Tectimicrobiota bacterium]
MQAMPIHEISPAQLQARLDRGDPVLVVDLRQDWEYRAGHIPGALSLFIEDIPRRLQELPLEQDIVFQCWHGHTSLDVAAYAIQQGWSAERLASLSGGMAGWIQTHGVTALERP